MSDRVFSHFHVSRLSSVDYERIRDEYTKILQQFYTQVVCPAEVFEKVDHGDVEVCYLILCPWYLIPRTLIACCLSPVACRLFSAGGYLIFVISVQQSRKKANLVPTDDVKMEYLVLSDPENIGIEEVFETHDKTFEKTLRRSMNKHLMTIFEDKFIIFDDNIMIKRSRKRCGD